MERTEALNQFFGLYGIGEGTIGIKLLYEYARTRERSLCSQIMKGFKELTAKTAGMQKNGEKGEIFALAFSVLRSEIVLKTGKIRFYAYDGHFYLDKEPIFVEWDGRELFSFIWKLEERLIQKAQKFHGKVLESDIKKFLLYDYTPFVIRLMTELVRKTVKIYGTEWLEELEKTADFRIIAGDYKGSMDEIYLRELVKKDRKALRLEFENYKKRPDEFLCRNYNNYNLQELLLKEINLTKSTFTNSDMNSCDFSRSFCMKTTWKECNLSGSVWDEAMLLDANFSGCDLTNNVFKDVFAPVSIPSMWNLSVISWLGADFTNTKLKNATFRGANLAGADFRGADFDHTDFTNANLYQAKFSQEAADKVKFSKAQLEQIILEEGDTFYE